MPVLESASGYIANMRPGAFIRKHITAVIYGFRNKLECLSLASLSSLVQFRDKHSSSLLRKSYISVIIGFMIQAPGRKFVNVANTLAYYTAELIKGAYIYKIVHIIWLRMQKRQFKLTIYSYDTLTVNRVRVKQCIWYLLVSAMEMAIFGKLS